MIKRTHDEVVALLRKPLFETLSEVADSLGRECYVVGGYVRDLYLNRETNDVDVVTVGSGIELAEAFARRMGRRARLTVFRSFGTAQVRAHGVEVEFVGARRESYSHDSRNPVVEDGTMEDDQNRRDFTVNALAICLNKARFGELVDSFDGLYDLENGIIRTPLEPEETFSDDPLRMMRCVRFATQLRFTIEEETFEALGRMKERIRIVSQERITDEFNKIMRAPVPSLGLMELSRSGLLEYVLPELAALDYVEKRCGKGHKNNFYHTLEVVDNVAANSDDLWLRWAALLHDVGKKSTQRWDVRQGWTFHSHDFVGGKMVPEIFRRMKLPLGGEMKFVQKIVSLHMRPIAIADDEVTDSAVRRLLFEAGDDIEALMTLCEADVTSKNEVRKRNFLHNFQLVRQKLVDIEEKDRVRNFEPPVRGEEIMERFALSPGPAVGLLKNAVKDAILDGVIPNEHDAAWSYVVEKARKMDLKLKAQD